MSANRHIVIMCGGGGTRLWPLSTGQNLKPFLKFPKDKSLLKQAFDRAKKVLSTDQIWILTTQDLAQAAQEHLPELPKSQFLLEPCAKNTAAALVFAALKLKVLRNQEDALLVLSSDHYIPNDEDFLETVEQAFLEAEKGKALVAIGIPASEPKTEYGYIQCEKTIGKLEICDAKTFVEKPNVEKAKQYLQQGCYVWNAGIFCWKISRFLEEAQQCEVDAFKALNEIDIYQEDLLLELYEKFEKVSIDYALMEKSQNVRIVGASFGWSDLGSWDAVYQSLSKEKNDNVVLGRANIIEGNQNLVVTKNIQVHLFGVDGLVCIEGPDGLMIIPQSKVPDLKRFLSKA